MTDISILEKGEADQVIEFVVPCKKKLLNFYFIKILEHAHLHSIGEMIILHFLSGMSLQDVKK